MASFINPLPLSSVSSVPSTVYYTHRGLLRHRPSRVTSVADQSVRPARMESVKSQRSSAVNSPRMEAASIVWFRQGDLRVQDHPGLMLALNEAPKTLACLYIHQGLPWEDAVLLGLRRALRARGGDLFIRRSNEGDGQAVVDFAQEIGADKVFVRRAAVGYEEVQVLKHVHSMQVVEWSEDVWGEQWLNTDDDMPEDYRLFLKWKGRRAGGVRESEIEHDANTIRLPKGPKGLEQGEVRRDDDEVLYVGDFDDVQDRLQKDSERVGLIPFRYTEEEGISDADGENLVRSYLEATERYEKVDFGRTFMPIFKYGLVSPRRLRDIVIQYERANGRLWQFFYRAGAKTILQSLESREFHCKLAYRDVSTSRTVDGLHGAKYWNFKGYIGRFVVEGDPSKPAVLLCHGFGASSQHWGRNVAKLREQYHVYCVDLIGFGRSEKPRTIYTQQLWECFIRDFVVEVIGRKAYIAGNSIGGYMAMAFASDFYPTLCSGAILVNPAGKLEDPTLTEERTATQQSSSRSLQRYILEEYRFARIALGNLLFAYLQRGIEKTLKRVYPTNPSAANKELADEIYRNSRDSGAVEVLASGFILPETRSLTMLLKDYQGPLLLYIGTRDPLNRSGQRAEKIQQICSQAELKLVNAGHCPHDEVPSEFNDAVMDWLSRTEQKSLDAPTTSVEKTDKNGNAIPDVARTASTEKVTSL
eukprot:Plantae.Rhodophyta-Hildenbrandia_rubra.ctg19593.p1 GENE.Plantae.Rhodophyta-Hildenbrandia_rubra.ctg19593~~Plantae.Rhodophyta-Hildenbrandia_rubra.ctg19593.p1  ORF type:complete len:700 (-),score=87.00 Plantae.Rhodophyta-Hildenbrandia_rubra.ctg19593:134-2233(-)